MLITLERDSEAFDAFARSIELDPLNLDVYERVSTLHFVRVNYEKSLALYNQALQIFFECAKLHQKRAKTLVHLKRYQEALDACNRAIQLDDTSASAYSEKGEILHQLRRFREALDAFDLSMSLNPNASTPHKQKAEMLADWGKYDDALAIYDHVIRLDLTTFILIGGKRNYLLVSIEMKMLWLSMTTILSRIPIASRGTSGSSFSFQNANDMKTGWQHVNGVL